MPLLVAALPYLVQYGIPVAAFIGGHILGWFHHKLTHAGEITPERLRAALGKKPGGN